MKQRLNNMLSTRHRFVLEWVGLILLVSAYFFWLSSNTISSVAINGRMLDAFEDDEYNHFVVIREALDRDSLCISWSAYGHLYFNLVLLPLFGFEKIAPISDRIIIFALRFGSTVPVLLTVTLTFWMARRYFGRVAGWLSSLSLMVLPYSVNYWSITSHPDALQMLFVTFGICGCCEFVLSQKKGWLYVSAFFAGLAFSTKYGGIFLLPVIWLLAVVEPWIKGGTQVKLDILFSWENIKASLQHITVLGVLFATSFFISSPCAFVDLQFLEGIVREMKHVSFGHIFQTVTGRFEWFQTLFSLNILGPVHGILTISAFILFVWRVWRSLGREIFAPRGVLWLFSLLYFGYLFARVFYRADRYLLVILPSLLILTSGFLVEAWGFVNRIVASKFVSKSLAVLVLLALGAEFYGGFVRQSNLIRIYSVREIENPSIEAGLWLEQNYPPSTRILYDKYSYIPPKFKRVQGSYGIDEVMFENFNPEVVVINWSIRGMYSDPANAEKFNEGAEKYMAIYNFYRLMENESLGFRLVYEFGSIKIFERKE